MTTLRPDIRAILDRTLNEDPATFVYAVNDQLAPVAHIIEETGIEFDGEGLIWVLMELVSNAVNARLGNRLMEFTDLGRNDLLEGIGLNIIYPLEGSSVGVACREIGDLLTNAMGVTFQVFIGMPLLDKFEVLGIDPDDGWITLIVRIPDSESVFSVTVESDDRVCDDDHAEISRRFNDMDKVTAEIDRLRLSHTCEDGSYRIPTFTGGGGYGLIASIRTCSRLGFTLEYLPTALPDRRARFRVALAKVRSLSK